MKIFIYTVITIVVLAIVAGFFIVGSPKEERLRRFDDIRVQNLQFLQGEIVNYWQRKERLPDALDDLKDDIRGVMIPGDPEYATSSYIYEAKGPLTFLLCATFARPSVGREQGFAVPKPVRSPEIYYNAQETWEHESGLQCFERTIDKEIYKPFKEQ